MTTHTDPSATARMTRSGLMTHLLCDHPELVFPDAKAMRKYSAASLMSLHESLHEEKP